MIEDFLCRNKNSGKRHQGSDQVSSNTKIQISPTLEPTSECETLKVGDRETTGPVLLFTAGQVAVFRLQAIRRQFNSDQESWLLRAWLHELLRSPAQDPGQINGPDGGWSGQAT